jgi:hypothetical protein
MAERKNRSTRSVPLDHILLVEEGKGITHVLEARKKLAK